MGILSRYVFWQAAGALVLVTLSLTGMVWIGVALRQLELITSQGQNIGRFLLITLLAIPTMMALIAPIALLLASIHVLHKLSGDSELIVMTAGGMPAWALLKPLGLLAILVALAVGSVNHVVGPWSQVKLRDMAAEVRTDLMSFVLQPWRFTTPEQKLTLHIRDRSPAGELLGLMMHDARDASQIVTYLAERGLVIKQGTQAYLRMDKGHIVRKVPEQPAPQIIVFDSYIVDLTQLEQRVEQTPTARPRERSTWDLLTLDPNDPKEAPQAKKAMGELHERLVSPLYALVFVLIVVAHMGQAQTVRQNHTQAGIGAFALAIGCRVAGIAAGNAVSGKGNAVPYVYAIPVAAMALAVFAVYWHAYPRAPSRLQRQMTLLNAGVKARLAALFTRTPMAAPATSAAVRRRG
ncbi:MAG: LptF/LptG family permease [Hyphomicrobiaceae bacterium]|nr:LptF/LptG family permease [Hyphomicrobiaceae bacterium]